MFSPKWDDNILIQYKNDKKRRKRVKNCKKGGKYKKGKKTKKGKKNKIPFSSL